MTAETPTGVITTCPPQHAARLAAAGFQLTKHPESSWAIDPPDHGCPLCWTYDREFCETCHAVTIAVIEHESPAPDPWCPAHAVPDPARRGECVVCDELMARAYREHGWTKPTGHAGAMGCIECRVCGICQGSGRVCRLCERCDQCPIETPDGFTGMACERVRWSSVRRREVTYYVHQVWNPETRKWAA